MNPSTPPLPIEADIPAIANAFETGRNLVLVAPPGAGKSTRLPLALLDAPWLDGAKVLVVMPRRLAALGAAKRMADQLGQSVGQRVGHRVRLDTKVSKDTQLEVITDGVFTRIIASDPELSGIGLVLFDEVHERALAADLGLAFALEAQSVLRPDLRIGAMSATVEGAAFEELLGQNAPCTRITSKGAMFPVETHYAPTSKPPVEAVVEATQDGLMRYKGDGLVFLPTGRQIDQACADLRQALGERIAVHALYGAMPRRAQDDALAPDPQRRRKIVVASSIAETSLTIPGVRFVVDSGLARKPTYDPVRGVTRLVTRPASRASLDQRRGRAGRTAPGHCTRLWRAEEEGGRPAQDRPEMLDADLAPLRLHMAAWGALQADSLPFLDPPPARAWEQAGQLLASLGALDEAGSATALGKAMVDRPTHPRLAAMLQRASKDQQSDVAWAAIVAGDLPQRGPVDAIARLTSTLRDKRQAQQLRTLHQRLGGAKGASVPGQDVLVRHLIHAYPDRIAKRQKDDGKRAVFKLTQGMQAQLDQHDPLALQSFLLVLDLGSGRAGGAARIPDIRLAMPLEEAVVREERAGHVSSDLVFEFERQTWSVQVRERSALGNLTLSQEPRPRLAGLDALDHISAHIQAQGVESIAGKDKGVLALLARYQAFFAARDEADALMERRDQWVPALLGMASAPPFTLAHVQQALRAALTWQEGESFDAQWPSHVELGPEKRARIAYDHPAGPCISVRPQWLYGRDLHPTLGTYAQPLLIEFLSPAQRPIALSADLPAFWRAGWLDVRKDMRARYPKHDWPLEPWNADASASWAPRKKSR